VTVAAAGAIRLRLELESPAVPSLPERAFRITALAEAASFLALLVATYVKYGHDEPVGVQVLGPLHGLLFVAYVLLALNLAPRAGWGTRTTLWVLVGAVLPFGGFAVERWLSRRPVDLSV
jgi:integral membrane protein